MKLKFKFTIARKLFIGFSILAIAVFSTSYLTYKTLDRNLGMSSKINKTYAPSADYLNQMVSLINDSKMLIKNWVFIEKQSDTYDKIRLEQLHDSIYPGLKSHIAPLLDKWETNDQNKYFDILTSIDSLFEGHKEIMDKLNSFENYNNPMIIFEVEGQVAQNGKLMKLTDRILSNLENLAAHQEFIVNDYNHQMEESFANFQYLIIVIGIILILSILTIGFITSNSLIGPINKIRELIFSMGKGVLPVVKKTNRSDEIGEMGNALAELVKGLKSTSEFALKIGDGNFSSEFKPLSDNDVLGNSLIMMRENLIKADKEAEIRKIENFQRSWASQGLAEFGEILRKNNDNMEKFSSIIVAKLVRYLDAAIGGLYVVNDDKKEDLHLELISFFAYDRQKFIKKRIDIGENLVGQCFQENDTLFLTDIPKGYVHITSGIGHDDPKSLLIVPLKMNEIIYGVVEIASFNVIEPYQIEFVEKIGESIASTISNVKININTAKLLAESNEKSDRLARQEEEVRRNIQEMQAMLDRLTIEKSQEKEKHDKQRSEYESDIQSLYIKLEQRHDEISKQKLISQNLMMSINNSFGYYEIDLSGIILTANNRFLKFVDIPSTDIINQNIYKYLAGNKNTEEEFSKITSVLIQGRAISDINHYIFNGISHWFYETFTPVKDDTEKFYKAMVLVSDISEFKSAEQEVIRQIDELKNELELLRSK